MDSSSDSSCFVLFIHSFISIQPLGRFGRNRSSVRWPVWLWHAASWANFLGVGCHYFPPPLDIPTFAARCLHVRNDERDPNSQRWNCGRECCPVILPKWRLLRHLGIFYMLQIYNMGPMALLPLWRKACWGFFHHFWAINWPKFLYRIFIHGPYFE